MNIIKQCGYKNKENEIVKIHVPPPKPTKNTVSGFVYDSAGNPLANVSVKATNVYARIITDETGMFFFSFDATPDGNEYSVTYSKPGYESKTYHYYEIPKTNINIVLNQNQ
jgi:hypothetical protein